MQVKSDLNAFAIPYNTAKHIALGPVCTIDSSSYFPSHTNSVYLEVNNEAVVRPGNEDTVGAGISLDANDQTSPHITTTKINVYADVHLDNRRQDGSPKSGVNSEETNYHGKLFQRRSLQKRAVTHDKGNQLNHGANHDKSDVMDNTV